MFPETAVAWFALVATFLGGVLSYGIAVVARRREADTPRVQGYSTYVLAGGTWALAYAFVLLSPSEMAAYAFDTLRAATAVSTAWLFLIFVANYTGYRDTLAGPLRVAFAVDVVVYTVLYATDPIHGYVFVRNEPVTVDGLTVLAQEPNVLFVLHFFVVVGCVFGGLALLVRFVFATRNVYREQTVVVLVGAFVTTTAAIVVSFNLAGSGNWQYFDPTPVAFTVNGVIVGWALFRLDFLTVGPLASTTLLEEMEDALFVVDEDDRVVDVNPRASALVADPVGQPLDVAIPDVVDAMQSDGTVAFDAPDGPDDAVVYDVNVTPLRGPYDVRRGSLVVLRDVTDRIERERLLERRNEQLDEFADVVSHDLRNPLGVAKGYAELAKESGDPADVAEVERALDRMDELVEDLLALARSDRDEVEGEPVALDACAGTAWDTVETPAGTLSVATDATVVADRSRLQQLFENLFRNAVEHGSTSNRTRSDDAVEHGSTSNRAQSGDAVEHGSVSDDDAPADVAANGHGGLTVTVGDLADGFFVADDGVGIPEDERESVLDSGYSTADDGTGYGLAIVKSIAQAHDWTVEVAESADGGARFEFHDVDRPADDAPTAS